MKNIPHRIGWWVPESGTSEAGDAAVRSALLHAAQPVILIEREHQLAAARGGRLVISADDAMADGACPVAGYAPSLVPENLGDPRFKARYRLRYPYVVGAMANGITSVEMVQEAGRAGMVGFFGAAGLSLGEIEAAIDRLQSAMGALTYGFNLIYTPSEPESEQRVVDMYLRRGVALVSASAYMDMTPPLVHYRVKGIHRDDTGAIVCPNRIVAKVSRVEVARKFFSPPPAKILKQLLERGLIDPAEYELASHVPMADTLSAEADSGGHTDNRPAITLLPTMLALRDEMERGGRYPEPLLVGLGGGIATPAAAAAAFAMGAAYILTGSVNQSCLEAGTSEAVRNMLAETTQADIIMAPAADMFEMGVKVQVLKRGTMFPLRAAKLYDLYCRYDRYQAIPDKERAQLERDFFRCSYAEVWEETRRFFMDRDPAQIERAQTDPRHQMALVFRSYLGRSSNWANCGDPTRKIDYQIWCGPAMGAFNQWVKGSFLERVENRRTAVVALNLLLGAAVVTRAHWLRSQGAKLPTGSDAFTPLEPEAIHKLLSC